MVKFLAILILLIPLGLCAQEAIELIELDLPSIEYQAWEKLYEDQFSLKNQVVLDWVKDETYSLHNLHVDYQGQQLYFNFQDDWENNLSYVNFAVKIKQNQLFEELNIGHYRIRFGSGITLGSGSKRLDRALIEIEKPPHPQSYSPLGAAARFKVNHISGLLFGSIANREAKLSPQNKIISLAKTKHGLKDTSTETIWGGAIGYESKLFKIGLTGYAQAYDKHFVNPSIKKDSAIFALYWGLRFKEHSLDAESGTVNQNPHHFLAWNYRHQGFEQTFSFALDPDQRQLAYFSPREVLSRDANTMELAWDARFPLFKNANLNTRFAFDQNARDHISSKGLVKRLLASFDYSPKEHDFRFTISHFDREILSQIGEEGIDYSVTRPSHWRFELGYKDQVFPHLQLILNSRYHLENKDTWKNNAFYYHSAIRFSYKNSALKFGYQGWQNAKTGIYYEDDLPLAWSLSQKEEQNLYLAGDLQLKNIKLGLNYRQSLTQSKDQRLVLNLGIWL